MSTQITHIVLSNKVFETYFSGKSKKDFYTGTSFPDIRYLAKIPREKVHFKGLKLEEIQKLDSFEAGFMFHSLVDEVREKYVELLNLYDLVPQGEYITQATKFIEDQMFYDKISNWQEYIYYLDEILPQELEFGANIEDVNLWHESLRSYMKQPPTYETVYDFLIKIKRPKEMAEEVISLMKEVKNNQEALKIFNGVYDNFEDLLL